MTHPEETLKSVCAFLGEDFEPRMLKYYDRSVNELGFVGSERWKYNTLNPLEPGRIDAWREALSSHQVAIIDRTVGERLKRLDYRDSGVAAPGAWSYAWSRFRDRIPWAVEVMTGAARRKRGPRRRRW